VQGAARWLRLITVENRISDARRERRKRSYDVAGLWRIPSRAAPVSLQERSICLQQVLPASGILYCIGLPLRDVTTEQVSISRSVSAGKCRARRRRKCQYMCGNTPCDPDGSHFILGSIFFTAIFSNVIWNHVNSSPDPSFGSPDYLLCSIEETANRRRDLFCS
jgi:hypothetical protein